MPTGSRADRDIGSGEMDDVERDDDVTQPSSATEAGVSAAGGDARDIDESGTADEPEDYVTPGLPRQPFVYALIVLVPLLVLGVRGFNVEGLIAAGVAATLVALAAIDIEHGVLPNRIVFPAIAIVFVAQVATHTGDALEYVLAGLAAAAFLALPLIVRRDAVGLGDVKLALLLGLAAGWEVFAAIVIGCLAIVPVALWMLLRGKSIRGATLPFGPFLAFGTIVVLLMP